MEITWKQVLLCSTAAAVAGYIGYKYISIPWKTNPPKPERENRKQEASSKKVESSKEKEKSKAKKTKSSKKPSEVVNGIPAELTEIMEMCDASVTELQKLSTEDKQRVFYAMLTKGEFVMNQGDVPKALEYFCKAVSMVPNPGEVVAAFQKMLPPPIFNALLDRIQSEVQTKISEYFANILGKNDFVTFKDTGFGDEDPELGRKVYEPFAAKDIKVGDILWEETADVLGPLHKSHELKDRCEFCLSNLDDRIIVCSACNMARYCSEKCRYSSELVLHPFFCKPDSIILDGVEELRQFCIDNESSMGLLMLRYISLLLSEELRGNGAANNGPFAHYDHLKPFFNAPSETDKKEAKILRKIFAATNKDVVEFLSDEIYASMKGTLARNVAAVGLTDRTDPINPSRAESRELIQEPEALAFFHVSAHIPHSCDPNALVIPTNGSLRHIKVSALKNIARGETLTISYLPFAENTSTSARQLHLMRIFGIFCKCSLCAHDGVIVAAN